MPDRIKMRATIPTFPGATQVSPSNLTADSVRVIAGASYSNPGVYEKWYPFSSTYFDKEWFPYTANTSLSWLGYNFPSAENVRRYKFLIRNPNYGPNAWSFEYSDDGASWNLAHSVTGTLIRNMATYDSGVIASAGAHAYWRIRYTAMGAGDLQNNLIVGAMSFWV